MSKLTVYINPLDENGAYEGFQEVTKDVDLNAIGKITRKLDNNNYNVGLFSFSNTSLRLRNDHGFYSEPGQPRSIFKSKRTDSLVKILWSEGEPAICGSAICGISVLGPELEIYKGFINDDSLASDIDDQKVKFAVLGMESLFDRVETPFAALSSGVAASTTIFNILNVSGITDLLTVSALNISLGNDQTTDTIADLENTTVKEALDILLEASNAILYIESDVVYIVPRDPTATTPVTFYGQASNIGIENIVDISKIKSGRAKMFNFWTWSDTTLSSKEATSITNNGVRKKEVDFTLFTNTVKRQAILDDLRDEFGPSKREMDLSVSLTREALTPIILDRINMDYPTIYTATDPEIGAPIYGVALYGTAKYPRSQWSLNLTTAENFKIIGININIKRETITYNLREV